MSGSPDLEASQQLRLPAAAESVGTARRAAAEFAATHGIDSDAVALAVSEAVTNAIVHGYKQNSEGAIALELRLNGEGVLVTVADDGEGFRPNWRSPGLGVGLPLVAAVADEVAISRTDSGGTAVRMRFRSP
jgi:serine/threonine-protein kinase RsbW